MRTHTRRFLTVGLALCALVGLDMPARGGALALPVGASTVLAQEDPDDPEERAYREARRAVSRSDFERAADLFASLRERHPEGRYAPDAHYWQAYALYRLDGLYEALALLERQLERYPEARVARDARDLELRIRGQLAERGDARAAERALRQAEAALARGRYAGQGVLGATYAAEAALAQSQYVGQVAMRNAEMAMRMAGVRGQLGWPPGVPGADQEFPEGCEDEDVQHAALQALMRIETDRALPILRRVLERRDECSVPLRKQAIFVLSQHEPEAAEDLMIEIATNDPEPEVQEAAVFWLAQVGTARALEALVDIIEALDDPGLQENAIFALSQHESPRAGELLRSYALDTSKPDRLREKAIFWLSQHPDHADAAFLMDLYGQLETEALKESVFHALAQYADDGSTEWMLQRALDGSEPIELRKQALFWAGQRETLELSRLTGLYERLTDREMKEQLIFLYSQRPESEAVDRLIEVARAEDDAELRKRAVFWLGQTGDERAIEFLLGLVDDPPR